MCRFVSDRFLRSYIFHVETRAFPRVAPLKVSTTAERFASLASIFLSGFALSPSSELIAASSRRSSSFSPPSLLRGLVPVGKSSRPGDPINFDNCTADYCISDVRPLPFPFGCTRRRLVITDFCRRNALSRPDAKYYKFAKHDRDSKDTFLFETRRRSAHIVFNKPEEL